MRNKDLVTEILLSELKQSMSVDLDLCVQIYVEETGVSEDSALITLRTIGDQTSPRTKAISAIQRITREVNRSATLTAIRPEEPSQTLMEPGERNAMARIARCLAIRADDKKINNKPSQYSLEHATTRLGGWLELREGLATWEGVYEFFDNIDVVVRRHRRRQSL